MLDIHFSTYKVDQNLNLFTFHCKNMVLSFWIFIHTPIKKGFHAHLSWDFFL